MKRVLCTIAKVKIWECLLCQYMNVERFDVRSSAIVTCEKCGNKYHIEFPYYEKKGEIIQSYFPDIAELKRKRKKIK